MKIYNYKNGYVMFEKTSWGYTITLRIGTEVKDKVRCDDYINARAYCRSFRKIAKIA